MAQNEIKYKVIVIGGSAGSLDAIIKIIAGAIITNDIFYILIIHRKNDADSVLSDLLASQTKLTVKEVEDKDAILPGHLYIAPADYHLLVENQYTFSLDSSEKVYYSRPSIDVTFESVADVFGSTVIGVLLSGANADGAKGLYKIKQSGGYTIVQNPLTADVDYMPKQAMQLFKPDAVISSADITGLIKTVLNKLVI